MNKNLIIGSDSLAKLSNGNTVEYINFDNAATTPPFKSVVDEIVNFAKNYSSVHRGNGYKSSISSAIFDDARNVVLDFIGGNKDYHSVIFVKNTTDAINKLSFRLNEYLKDKIVLTTYMEHHSNLLPWKHRYNTEYIEVDINGRLCIDDLKFKLNLFKDKVGLVAVSGASNVTGYINPIYEIADLCHKYNAKILVDGAQLIPHSPFNMQDIDSSSHIDFLAFSSHKMYAPFGVGVLIGPKDFFNNGISDEVGGGTIKFVSMDTTIWEEAPEKEEAGTPNLMGVLALSTSIKTLKNLGMENIDLYEKELTSYALSLLKTIPNLIIYDDMNVKEKVSIISFNMKGLEHYELAKLLYDYGGIAVRNGCFCAQPYASKLLKLSKDEIHLYMNNLELEKPGLVRISFGLYNDKDEIYLLYHLLNDISQNIEYYKTLI